MLLSAKMPAAKSTLFYKLEDRWSPDSYRVTEVAFMLE